MYTSRSNPILSIARQTIYSDSPLLPTARDSVSFWAESMEGGWGNGLYHPDQIDHARRVLTRLANLTA